MHTPEYPLVHVPLELPLDFALRSQFETVAAVQAAGTIHVLELCVHVPLLQLYEQLPVYPLAHVPLELPLAVALKVQFELVVAVQELGTHVDPDAVYPVVQDGAQDSAFHCQVPLLHPIVRVQT